MPVSGPPFETASKTRFRAAPTAMSSEVSNAAARATAATVSTARPKRRRIPRTAMTHASRPAHGCNVPVTEVQPSIPARRHGFVVGRDDQAAAVPVSERPQEVEHGTRRLVVEVAGRFVGQDEARRVRERAGDRDPLALTSTECGRQVARPVSEPHCFEQLACSSRRARRRGMRRDCHRQLDVLLRGQGAEQSEVLEHESDRRAAIRGQCVTVELADVDIADLEPTGLQPLEPTQEREQRGLAGARTTGDRDPLARARSRARDRRGPARVLASAAVLVGEIASRRPRPHGSPPASAYVTVRRARARDRNHAIAAHTATAPQITASTVSTALP